MKKVFIRVTAAILCTVIMVGLIPVDVLSSCKDIFTINAYAIETYRKSVVNGRDDGKWLYPLIKKDSKTKIYQINDWAGCNHKNSRKCPFNCGCTEKCSVTNHDNHNGLDLYASSGTPVYAAAPGRAYKYNGGRDSDARGITVIVEHEINKEYSYYSFYQHLSSISVESGARVNAGDEIAKSGSTYGPNEKNKVDPHLHFGIFIGKNAEKKEIETSTFLDTYVKQAWITTPGLKTGKIVTNPSMESPYDKKNWLSVRKHAGSVTYVFDESQVTAPKQLNTVSANVASGISISDPSCPKGSLPKGKSFGIRGIISSNHMLKDVSAYIINRKTGAVLSGYPKSVNPNSNSYSLKGYINNNVVFNTLNDGSYIFKVTATDIKNYTKVLINEEFTVGSGNSATQSVNMPTFREPVAKPGGYMVYINVPSGATVYYTSNGSTPTTSSNKYAGGIDVKTSCTIKAIAVKGSAKSGVASRAVSVGQVAQPTITSTLTSSDMCVTLDCSTYGAKIYYTLDGSAPSPYKYYYNGSPIRLTSSATIKAYAIKDGCANSPTAQKTVSVTVPSAPGIDIPTGTTVAVGDPIEIRWTARENATSHMVRVYRNGALVDKISVSGNRFAYIPQVSGAYTFGVDAVNFAGASSSDSGKTVTAKDPVTVRFVDYDGSVIKEQTVRYGYNASVPLTPKRKGWVFRDWDSHNYLRATGDMTIKALYDREKYIVRFVDEDGITLAAQQEVEFESAVVLPQDPTTTLAGYEFMGWRVISSDTSSALDYNCVDANMTLQAVFDWGNKDLPVAVQTVSATKNDANSYAVDVTLNNGASETTYCRMLVTLKTSTGKAVQTIIRDVTLQPRETGRIVSESEIICDKVATVVEINIVGLDGNRTGGAYSSAKTATISDKSNYYYSEWSTVKPNVSDYETKTMYRYRTREYTTSTSPSLSGWTQYDAITTYSDWGATQNTTSAPAVSDTLQIVGSPTTTYTYYHYCCNYYGGKNNVDSIPYGSGKHYYHEFTRSSPLPAFNMADKGGKQAYGGSGSGAPICMTNGWYAWFLKSTTTTYSYQTRTKTTTYYYYRWSDFTPFGDVAVSATNDREVQTATYYRYKIYNEVATSGEDNRGKTYTNANMELPGVISKTDLDLSGKKANVIVYKASLNDPTASHIEYVGQITIGAGNTYDISFVPAQEPDDAESNYTVSLAIEGQTSLFNIGTIYCSKSNYQVDFYADGTLINTQTVEEGKDAVVPTPPEIPGKTFVGWDNDTTNVIAPRTIKAYYVDETYSVVFADFENDFITMNQYTYGEIISVPSVDAVEGKTFLGWEGLDEDNPIATEHAIFIAKYDTGTFTVKFDDGFGNILSTQTIEYGESATPPDAPEKEGYVFMGWRTDVAWWNAKSDMIVTPIWIYENTAATPEVNVENLYFGGEITAKTDTAGATVYYAIDDGRGEPPVTLSQRALEKVNIEVSDAEIEEESGNVQPLSLSLTDWLVTDAYAYDEEYDYGEEAYDYYEWLEYDESMVFTENTTFYFYAAGDNMNDSEIVTLDYAYEPVMNPYEDHTGETHTVTFIDYDGFVLDEQTVEYFKDATAPEIEEREGYVFIGWDTDFTHVINDIEVTAQYVPENEYVTFTLNTDSVTMTAGSTYSLNLTVTNDPGDLGEIIWKSSNNSVASVNADGFILANNSGEAIITAKSENNIYSAKCKVVVLPDANKTVVLRNDSKLSLEGGFLTQIPIASSGIHRAATVAEIKKQIATQNVTIVDSDGNVLEDTDTVTTNTAIRLIADDVVIDAVIIIVTGDYDCNGVVNNRDAARIMRYLVNKESPNESQIYAIDVNGDGSVNNRDAAMVSRYLVGKETL